MSYSMREDFDSWMDADKEKAIKKIERRGETAEDAIDDYNYVWLENHPETYFWKKFNMFSNETYALLGQLDNWIETQQEY